MLEAFAGIAGLRDEKSFVSWIFRILYSRCCAILSSNIRRREAETQTAVYDDHLAPELEEALAILSGEDRDIVLLSVVSGYKTREIAQMLNINHATVRSKLSRALAKMKDFLE